jgi:hypothetical protein
MTMPSFRPWLPVALAGAGVLAILLLIHAWAGPRPGPRFRDVRDLKGWAERHGLYCRSDWQDGRVTAGLAVSTSPLTWERVSCLPRGDVKAAPWQGVVWAINRTPALDGMPAPPLDGECRVWGGILVTGDPRLLDHIEGEADDLAT